MLFQLFEKNYAEYANIAYQDLPTLFPIETDNGAFELPDRFSNDFYNSTYYCDRPLFDDTMPVLISLKNKGLNLFTLSAAGDPAKKRKWLECVFVNIFNELEFSPVGIAKDEALKDVLKKHALNTEETVFIDDRFFNVKAGINAGVHTVRMQPEHHLPLPEELSHIKSLKSLSEFEKYVDKLNSKH